MAILTPAREPSPPRVESARRRVLLGCYGVPSHGGASTVGYRLLQVLRSAGVDAHYLTIVDPEDPGYYRGTLGNDYGNPRALADASTCELEGRLFDPHPELERAIEELSPDVMVAIGTNSGVLMKQACASRPLLLLTSGCQQMMDLIARGEVRDYIAEREILARSRGRPRVSVITEQKAVECASLVVTHADPILLLFRAFFPYQEGKLWPEVLSFAEWIFADAAPYTHLARPFAERDVDALFIASSWARPEKNARLARQIVAGLEGVRIHVVGEAGSVWPGATHHGFVKDREVLFGLMGRARTVVCPSAFDAAPGILFEASAMGCNVVASPNCGNAHLCHKDLLVQRADAPGFIRAIRASLERKYEDHADAFRGTNPTQRLMDLVQVV